MEFKRFALAMVGHFLASLFYVLRRLRLVNAVVDTTSYLEHREELKELWEKRMMADDNQSPSSSTSVADEKASPKTTAVEEGSEEEVATTTSQSEAKPDNTDHKLTNGVAKPLTTKDTPPKEDVTPNGHAHVEDLEPQVVKDDPHILTENDVENNNNNNSPDSLEVEEYVEKTYTSETSLVMKQTEIVTSEADVPDGKTDEKIREEVVEESKSEKPADSNSELNIEEQVIDSKPDKVEEVAPAPAESALEKEHDVPSTSEAIDVPRDELVSAEHGVPVASPEKFQVEEISESKEVEVVTSPAKVEDVQQASGDVASPAKVEDMQQVAGEVGNNNEVLFKSLEVQQESLGEDDDGFVRVEECLPKMEGAESDQESFEMIIDQKEDDKSIDITEKLISLEEEKVPLTNGHAPPESPAPPTSPCSPKPADGEGFLKSGGLKRVVPPGVQQTEQPYSTCTTETKIAMEIREMREREEELRVMRERAQSSPVPPLPAVVARTPSPVTPRERPVSAPSPTPSAAGYRVSSVFGPPRTPVASPVEESKLFKGKESAVEKEIRIARDREEELRKLKGLPPREDDSYVKPSQVKSSQVRVFGKLAGGGGSHAVKQAATAKIQLEIEEQTQREMALRDTGSIQTISQERTDSRVARLKTEATPPVANGNGHVPNGGGYTNGRSSPDVVPAHKRGSPSPTGPRPASIFSQTNGRSGISMHKFISSKGKESTFSAPKSNGAAREEGTRAVVPPNGMVQLKRTVSVESKIQQEIMEMKQREEELKMLHMNQNNIDCTVIDDEQMNQKNNCMEFENGNVLHEEDLNPRHNKLIAQWEQRIQKAES